MVFQSYAIWPHLTVFENVALPLTYGRKKNCQVVDSSKGPRGASISAVGANRGSSRPSS